MREMVLMNASAALYVAGKAIWLSSRHLARLPPGWKVPNFKEGSAAAKADHDSFGMVHDRDSKPPMTQAALENGAAVKTLDAYVAASKGASVMAK